MPAKCRGVGLFSAADPPGQVGDQWVLGVGASGISQIAEQDSQTSFLKTVARLHDTRGPSPYLISHPTMLSRQALFRSMRAAAPQRAVIGQTRSFAAAVSNEKIKAPVALFGLDGTYATALVWLPTHPIDLQRASRTSIPIPIELQTDSTYLSRVANANMEAVLTRRSALFTICSTRLPSRPRASSPPRRPSIPWPPSSRRTPSSSQFSTRLL